MNVLLAATAVTWWGGAVPPWVPLWLPPTIAVWVVLYVVVMLVMNAGVMRLPRSAQLADEQCPTVSVVVSARNEERDLPACIECLLALNYPPNKLQIILVNDFSTDATGAMVTAAAANRANVQALHSEQLTPNGLEAKARGVAHGINAATGEWVFITDADGTVGPNWLRASLSRADSGTGMVGGALLVRNNGFLGLVERMSWGFLQTFSAGLAGWGAPIVCLGPNMAIRRSVYIEAGGLERANFRVAEDLALFRMVRARKMGVQMYMDAVTTVTIVPVPSAAHLLSQHRRWLGGGVEQSAWYKVLLLIALWWGFGVLMFLLFGWLISPFWWAVFLTAKIAVDWLTLGLQQRRMNIPQHARWLGVLQLYHVVIIALLPPIFLVNQGIEWRGEGYAVRYR